MHRTQQKKRPGLQPNPAPSAYFLEFGQSSLDGQLILYSNNYDDVWDVKDYVNTRINERFKEKGIKIPFPAGEYTDTENRKHLMLDRLLFGFLV